MNKKHLIHSLIIFGLVFGGVQGLAFANGRTPDGGIAVEGEESLAYAEPQEPSEPSSMAVTPGLPGTVFRYLETFGETEVAYPADSDHLYAPVGVSLDNAGNLWVAESEGLRAMKYASSGAFLTSIGVPGLVSRADETHFAAPTEIAVAGDGSLWVVDAISHRVVKFDAGGIYLTQLGVTWEPGSDNAHFDLPVGLALDSAENIYISEINNHRIQVFQSNGFYSATIGTGEPGSGNHQFNLPLNMAFDDNDHLYVPDALNHRVQVFDAAHNYVATIGVSGEAGSDNDHFNSPRGVAVDADFIYVADSNNHRVQIFDRTTYGYVDTLGEWGSGDYQFDLPRDVAVDSAGNLYVSENRNHRVQKYAFDGSSFSYLHTFGTTSVPYLSDGYHYNLPFDVALDEAGNIAVIENGGRGHRLIVLDASGMHKFTVGEAGVPGDDNEHFNEPKGVAFDASGNIYAADCSNHRLQIFNSSGAWVARIGTGWGAGNYQFKCPSGVAVDSSGNIYIADADNHRIQIYDSNRVYVATLGVSGVPGSDNNHFKWPQDVEVDAGGNIYTAEWANHRVQKFNSSRVWQMTLGVTGACGYDFDHFCEPYGVAVDAAGNIYVAEKFGYRVQVFDASGAYLTTVAGAWGSQSGQLREPLGVEVDAAGNLYIADTLNHRVQKFGPGVSGWEQLNLNGFGVRANMNVHSLEVFNGQLYAGVSNWEQNGRLWRTADGANWEPASAAGFGMDNTPAIIDLIEFDGRLYAGVGWGGAPGRVWRSADGVTWEAVTTNGFGDGGNTTITSFAIFNGMLYAGVSNSNGAQIWRSSSGNSGSWLKVIPDEDETQGTTNVTDFAVYEGALYAAIEGNTPVQVWRSTNGSDWTAVVTDGYGDEDNYSTGGFAEFDGYLYLGNHNDVTGGQLWRSEDGATWTQMVGDGFGNPDNIKIESPVAFGGALYAVTYNPTTGMEVWRTPDGTLWEQVYAGGFGDSNNRATLWSNNTAVFECRLTFGTWNEANGGEVWSMLADGALCVDKRGPASAYYGEEVAYQMAVTYSSLDGSPAQNVSVVDDHYGEAVYISGDANEDGYLGVSETWIFEATGVIDPRTSEKTIVNEAIAGGEDMEGSAVTPGSDRHATRVLAYQLFLPLAARND